VAQVTKKKNDDTAMDTSMTSLRWELRANERVAHLVKDAYRGLSKALQVRLEKYNVMYGHWTFLRILWQTDGITQRQLSEQAGVKEPTTFSALQSMEQLGYVVRQKMPDNRKQVRVFLTPKGTALRSVLIPAAEEVNTIALEGIPMDDLTVFRRTLLAIIKNVDQDALLTLNEKQAQAKPAPAKRAKKSGGSRSAP
jgi:DNA-binding MarR family transcriptional regulator